MYILDVPISNISLSPQIDESNIKEGDDVMFDCHVKSNPVINKITWRHEVSHYFMLQH